MGCHDVRLLVKNGRSDEVLILDEEDNVSL